MKVPIGMEIKHGTAVMENKTREEKKNWLENITTNVMNKRGIAYNQIDGGWDEIK